MSKLILRCYASSLIDFFANLANELSSLLSNVSNQMPWVSGQIP